MQASKEAVFPQDLAPAHRSCAPLPRHLLAACLKGSTYCAHTAPVPRRVPGHVREAKFGNGYVPGGMLDEVCRRTLTRDELR